MVMLGRMDIIVRADALGDKTSIVLVWLLVWLLLLLAYSVVDLDEAEQQGNRYG